MKQTLNRTSVHVGALLVASAVVTLSTRTLTLDPPDSSNPVLLSGRAFAMAVTPLIVAAVPAGIYGAWKRKRLPGLPIMLWLLWAILTALVVLGDMSAVRTTGP